MSGGGPFVGASSSSSSLLAARSTSPPAPPPPPTNAAPGTTTTTTTTMTTTRTTTTAAPFAVQQQLLLLPSRASPHSPQVLHALLQHQRGPVPRQDVDQHVHSYSSNNHTGAAGAETSHPYDNHSISTILFSQPSHHHHFQLRPEHRSQQQIMALAASQQVMATPTPATSFNEFSNETKRAALPPDRLVPREMAAALLLAGPTERFAEDSVAFPHDLGLAFPPPSSISGDSSFAEYFDSLQSFLKDDSVPAVPMFFPPGPIAEQEQHISQYSSSPYDPARTGQAAEAPSFGSHRNPTPDSLMTSILTSLGGTVFENQAGSADAATISSLLAASQNSHDILRAAMPGKHPYTVRQLSTIDERSVETSSHRASPEGGTRYSGTSASPPVGSAAVRSMTPPAPGPASPVSLTPRPASSIGFSEQSIGQAPKDEPLPESNLSVFQQKVIKTLAFKGVNPASLQILDVSSKPPSPPPPPVPPKDHLFPAISTTLRSPEFQVQIEQWRRATAEGTPIPRPIPPRSTKPPVGSASSTASPALTSSSSYSSASSFISRLFHGPPLRSKSSFQSSSAVGYERRPSIPSLKFSYSSPPSVHGAPTSSPPPSMESQPVDYSQAYETLLARNNLPSSPKYAHSIRRENSRDSRDQGSGSPYARSIDSNRPPFDPSNSRSGSPLLSTMGRSTQSLHTRSTSPPTTSTFLSTSTRSSSPAGSQDTHYRLRTGPLKQPLMTVALVTATEEGKATDLDEVVKFISKVDAVGGAMGNGKITPRKTSLGAVSRPL